MKTTAVSITVAAKTSNLFVPVLIKWFNIILTFLFKSDLWRERSQRVSSHQVENG
jgi:hypothetical protein